MSSSLNLVWENRLKKSFYANKYTEEDRINLVKIINQFDCNEIYNPNITEHDIFKHIYKPNSHDSEMKAKRQPNPFMIFRTALGIAASIKNVKLGDGTCQSKTAGILWGGINPPEKKNFENLASKFKDLHKQMFPKYEYRPRQRNPNAGTFVDMNNNFVSGSNNQSMSQQPHIPQQTQPIYKDNNFTWDQSSFPPLEDYSNGIIANFILDGSQYPLQQDFLQSFQVPQFTSPEWFEPQQQQHYLPAELYQTTPLNNEMYAFNKVDYFRQEPPPSIAGNCLIQYDINNGSNFLDKNF